MNDAELLSLVFVAVMAAFYLMFIRPIHKDQERHKQQIRDLRIGDEVLTTSGFIARIKDIQVPAAGQTRIALELADGVVITAVPSAILERFEKTAAPSSEGQKEAPSTLRRRSGEP
jgi:preprotein translocase subunit YajC